MGEAKGLGFFSGTLDWKRSLMGMHSAHTHAGSTLHNNVNLTFNFLTYSEFR